MGIVCLTSGGVAKLVIAPACQAGDRGFNPRRSRFAPIIRGFFMLETGHYKNVRTESEKTVEDFHGNSGCRF